MKQYPIMLCFNNNYVLPGGVAIWSLLQHASKDGFYLIYVVHSDITLKNQNKLKKTVAKFTNASITFMSSGATIDMLWEKTANKGSFSKDIYCKLLIGDLFPQFETMFITDVDVLFLDDFTSLYESVEGKSEYAYAGVSGKGLLPEDSSSARWVKEHRHPLGVGEWYSQNYENDIGAGLLIANLEFLRRSNLAEKFISCIFHYGEQLYQPEQDVINMVSAQHNILLPLRTMICSYLYPLDKQTPNWRSQSKLYSKNEIDVALKSPIQLHYAAGNLKPWNNLGVPKAWIWVKYCIMSRWGLTFLMFYLFKRIPILVCQFILRCFCFAKRNFKIQRGALTDSV